MKNSINLNDNIVVLDYEHNFANVLLESDCYLRTTSTDGDSLSIREAISFKKKCIVSDVVSRPRCVVTYKYDNNDELEAVIRNIANIDIDFKNCEVVNAVPDLAELYMGIIK